MASLHTPEALRRVLLAVAREVSNLPVMGVRIEYSATSMGSEAVVYLERRDPIHVPLGVPDHDFKIDQFRKSFAAKFLEGLPRADRLERERILGLRLTKEPTW